MSDLGFSYSLSLLYKFIDVYKFIQYFRIFQLLSLNFSLLPSTPLSLQLIEIIGCEKMDNAKNDENRVKNRQNRLTFKYAHL